MEAYLAYHVIYCSLSFIFKFRDNFILRIKACIINLVFCIPCFTSLFSKSFSYNRSPPGNMFQLYQYCWITHIHHFLCTHYKSTRRHFLFFLKFLIIRFLFFFFVGTKKGERVIRSFLTRIKENREAYTIRLFIAFYCGFTTLWGIAPWTRSPDCPVWPTDLQTVSPPPCCKVVPWSWTVEIRHKRNIKCVRAAWLFHLIY